MSIPKFSKILSLIGLGLMALALAPSMLADEDPPSPQRTVVKATKYLDVTDIVGLVELVEVGIAVDPKRRLVVLRGPASKIDNAIKLIDALDTPEPPWGIELLVHLVRASRVSADVEGTPADLEPSLSELGELFGYRTFKWVDTLYLFATTDLGSARVVAPVRDGGMFEVAFDRATVLYGEPKNSVRFENLSISAPLAEIVMHTNLDVREDHQVVIGKSSLKGTGSDEDLVFVVEIRLKIAPRDGAR